MDDEGIGQLIAAADPEMQTADSEPTLRQMEIRDRIYAGIYMSSMMPARGVARRRWAVRTPLAVLTAVLAFLLVVAPAVIRTAPASAVTPRPLPFTPTSQSPQDVLEMVKRTVATEQHSGPRTPLRESYSVGWYLQLALGDGAVKSAAVIAPQITSTVWSADLSGRTTISAGAPYSADAGDSIPAADAPVKGTVLVDTPFGAGQFETPIPLPPGDSTRDIVNMLKQAGLASGGRGADMIDAIVNTFSYWTLTSEQQRVLLGVVLAESDVFVLGSTVDRADRDVIGVAADSSSFPGVRKILLVSRDTGRIVAVEAQRTTEAYGIPAGSVISYTLWDVDK
ncbi:hypothetical protein ET475_10715 [Microbacterium protaetiae]|uniref:CU044_5270 family protein n=1 Tax=Microbacterium protaetiae TaxID=2509458 RepID=A0A4P6EDS1_9MICO|nr:hypothetical protein [Microbacterium protaetiae]QAY60412.1 hypothetical protein ET475_10715 [Microbacterium protaetiae]